MEELEPHYDLRSIEPEPAIRENTPLKNITVANALHCVSQPLALRGSVCVKPAFVLDVEHQVTSIQVLHDEEEVLLCNKEQQSNNGSG